MNVRHLPGTALDRYLKLVRAPLSGAIGLLPGNGTGVKPAAKAALDRADASVRMVAGSALRDQTLVEEGQRLHRAVHERQRSVRLRQQAERQSTRADARVEEQEKQASRRRTQAQQRAKRQRQQATRARQAKVENAKQAEEQRLEASRRAANQAEETIEQREPKSRLEALQAETEALREREHALTATDEASRLRDAAEEAKAERKES